VLVVLSVGSLVMFRSMVFLLGMVGGCNACVGGLMPPGVGGLVTYWSPASDVQVQLPSASSVSFQPPKVFSLW
jgi:hypothetical protein